MAINVKDFEMIKAELREAHLAGEWEEVDQKWCGPGTGLVYDEVNDELIIGEEWKINDNGDVVRLDSEGPGVPGWGYVNAGPGVEK